MQCIRLLEVAGEQELQTLPEARLLRHDELHLHLGLGGLGFVLDDHGRDPLGLGCRNFLGVSGIDGHSFGCRDLCLGGFRSNTDDVLDKAEADVRSVCASADLAYEEEIIEL